MNLEFGKLDQIFASRVIQEEHVENKNPCMSILLASRKHLTAYKEFTVTTHGMLSYSIENS